LKLNLRYGEKILSIANTDHILLKLDLCYVITSKHVNRNCHHLIIYAQRNATVSRIWLECICSQNKPP